MSSFVLSNKTYPIAAFNAQPISIISICIHTIAIIIIVSFVYEKLKNTKKVAFGDVFVKYFSSWFSSDSAVSTALVRPSSIPLSVSAPISAPVLAPVLAPVIYSFKCPGCSNSYPDRVKYGKNFGGQWFCGETCNTIYKTSQMFAKQFAPQCNSGFLPANPALVTVFPLKVIPGHYASDGVKFIF